jgi:hypothetical protein
MFKQRRIAAIIEGLFPNPSTPNNIVLYIDPPHVKDTLLLRLEEWTSEPFIRLFQKHLAPIQPRSLDGYSRIDFELVEYNIKITVLTAIRTHHDLVYRIRHLDRKPNAQLTKRPFFCWSY